LGAFSLLFESFLASPLSFEFFVAISLGAPSSFAMFSAVSLIIMLAMRGPGELPA